MADLRAQAEAWAAANPPKAPAAAAPRSGGGGGAGGGEEAVLEEAAADEAPAEVRASANVSRVSAADLFGDDGDEAPAPEPEPEPAPEPEPEPEPELPPERAEPSLLSRLMGGGEPEPEPEKGAQFKAALAGLGKAKEEDAKWGRRAEERKGREAGAGSQHAAALAGLQKKTSSVEAAAAPAAAPASPRRSLLALGGASETAASTAAPPPDGPRCYLVADFSPTTAHPEAPPGATLYQHWSAEPIDGALACFAPRKTVPAFKLKQNGGKSELVRDAAIGPKYYGGWTAFVKAAVSFQGDFTFLPRRPRRRSTCTTSAATPAWRSAASTRGRASSPSRGRRWPPSPLRPRRPSPA